MGVPRGSFKNTVSFLVKVLPYPYPLQAFVLIFDVFIYFLQQGKFNPQYMKGSPHSSQRAKRSQTPDHMLASNEMQQVTKVYFT